jgi:hypothetical protein
VFAAGPLDPVTSMLGGGETTQRTLFVRLKLKLHRLKPDGIWGTHLLLGRN